MNFEPRPSVSNAHRTALARGALAAALMLALGTATPATAARAALRESAGIASDHRSSSQLEASRIPSARVQGRDPRAVAGDSIPVTTCADSGDGSLRAAVAAAVSGDTIDASALTCSTITLQSALTIPQGDLAIVGPGPDALAVTNGTKYGRVFTHTGLGTLELYGMTISSGIVSPTSPEADTRGGCIYSNGSVALGDIFDPADAAQGVRVYNCTAISTQEGVVAKGGGIYAKVSLSMAGSTVSGCHAVAQDDATVSAGGGVSAGFTTLALKYSEVRDNSASGTTGFSGGVDAAFMHTLVISHSTIAGNYASNRAGGAYLGTNSGEPVSIDNSTISGNTSSGEAGLVINVRSGPTPGSIRIASTTITANISTSVVGGALLGGVVELDSSIISGNGGRDVDFADVATGSDNIIGVAGGTPPPEGLIVTDDPGLAPLADNGGLTRTHALLEGSAAIDSGNNSFASQTDQRGSARSLGAAPDIGAYERDPDEIFRNGFD